ncbi:MAG: cytochrome c biogenesis protein ResB [Prevotella sp.]|nr:cytochrome c biogenesis protein ResB [Prevotella sp.]
MIWKKTWKLTEGFLIGAGLIAVGLMLHLTVGPVDWSLFAWPVNIISLTILLAVVAVSHPLRKHLYLCQFLTTYAAAVPALAYGAALTVLMGLTRQETNGTWLNDMLSFWPFVLIYAYIVLILGMVTVKRLFHLTTMMRDIPFLLNHVGLFMALTTGTLGNADMQQLQMWTTNNPEMANMFSDSEVFHQYERFAMDEKGRKVELPLAIELKRFIMEMYEDGITPKRYASEIVIYSKESLHQYAATIDVNKPVEIDGWKIYQKDYRLTDAGDACQISILELVSDPWLPWVYTGIYMMLAGAILLLLQGGKRTGRNKTAAFVEPETTEPHELG